MFLRMKYVTDRIIEQLKAHQFIFNNFVENCVVYEKMWKNAEEPDMP